MKSVAELQRIGNRLFPFCPSLPAIENSPPGTPTSSYMSSGFANSIELIDSNNNRTDRLMELEQTIPSAPQSLGQASVNNVFGNPSSLVDISGNAGSSYVSKPTSSFLPRPLSKTLSRTQSAPLSLDLAIAAANAVAAAAAVAAASSSAGSGMTNDSVGGSTTNSLSLLQNSMSAMDKQSLVKQRIRQTVLTRTASKQKLRQESVGEESEASMQHVNLNFNRKFSFNFQYAQTYDER